MGQILHAARKILRSYEKIFSKVVAIFEKIE